jgi:5'-nucleotidase
MTLNAQQLRDALEQQFGDCTLGRGTFQTLDRLLLPSRGFRFSWDRSKPACHRIVSASLETSRGVEKIVEAGLVRDPARTYRVTVNSYLAGGGDGFTRLQEGTERVGGPQDIDALIAYLYAFKYRDNPYDPTAGVLAKPRITRLDGGAACR